MRVFHFFLVLAAVASGPWWSVQTSGLDTELRGVSVVIPDGYDAKAIIWATGSNGVILRSINSGKTWSHLHVPQADSLDFRDTKGFDENTAYIMSSGEADKSRIYKTSDGGKTWDLQYTGSRKSFFLDAIACLSDTNCFALSDPVNGKFLLLHTEDGKQWKELANENMPPALPNEAAFAASGSILGIYDGREFYFGTGGSVARVFHSPDLGRTWTVAETPILSGSPSSGIFSINTDRYAVVAVGGDYKDPNRSDKNAAYSVDEGKTWKLAAVPPGGYRSAVAAFDGGYVTVGPNGADMSRDAIHWEHTDSISLNALSFSWNQGWAVGPHGTIAQFHDHTEYNIQNPQSTFLDFAKLLTPILEAAARHGRIPAIGN
jgi:photosystem II stability/assembly factor-like uncharacterized protein